MKGAQWFQDPQLFTGGVADQRHSLSHLRLGWPRNSPTYLEGWPVVSRLKKNSGSRDLSCWMKVILERIYSKLRTWDMFGDVCWLQFLTWIFSGWEGLDLWLMSTPCEGLPVSCWWDHLLSGCCRPHTFPRGSVDSWNGGNHGNWKLRPRKTWMKQKMVRVLHFAHFVYFRRSHETQWLWPLLDTWETLLAIAEVKFHLH